MKSKPGRKRLDLLLVERGLAENQSKAQAMILAGEIHVKGACADKAGVPVAENARIEISSRLRKYASRGGTKLAGALADFSVAPAGKICLDVGSSTGGFTDCLLQHGAARVYAVDVNIAQIAWKLREDARVILLRRNARELRRDDLPEAVDLVVADVSFISVSKVLAPAAAHAIPGADCLILIKLSSTEDGAGILDSSVETDSTFTTTAAALFPSSWFTLADTEAEAAPSVIILISSSESEESLNGFKSVPARRLLIGDLIPLLLTSLLP